MNAPPDLQGHSHQGGWHHLRHHALVALVVASLVSVLHHGGQLGWLDAAMLRLLGSADPAQDAPAPTHLPKVLLIGPRLFETVLGQASPLNRDRLAQLIDSVASGAPAIMAIDLDLSPGPGPHSAGQAELDSAIGRASQAGVRTVLTVPFRVTDPDLRARKFDWLQRMCGLSGVAIALSDVVTHSGAVLQFDGQAPTVGVVASRLAGPARGGEAGLCAQVKSMGARSAALLLDTRFDEPFRQSLDFGSNLTSFNAEFFQHAQQLRHELRSVAIPLAGSASDWGSLKGRTVFIGSGYNPSDKFMLPLASANGHADGVEVHAAVYASMVAPVTEIKGAMAFLLDVVIGIGAAYLFAATWQWQRLRQRRWTLRGGLQNYAVARALWLFNGALLLFVVLALMVLARAVFFPGNLWINPGPIVIGVFAKFMLANGQDETHAAAISPPRSIAWIQRGGLAVIVIAGLVSLFGHH